MSATTGVPAADLPALALLGVSLLLRVAPIIMLAPVLGAGILAPPLALAAAALLAMAVAPLAPLPALPAWAPGLVDVAAFAVAELLVGTALGLAVAAVFYGARAAGWLAGRLGASPGRGGEGAAAAPESWAFMIVALALFAAMGGHRLAIAAVAATYDAIPAALPPRPLDPAGAVPLLGRLTGDIFTLALLLAGPVIAATLVADLIAGYVARIAPGLRAGGSVAVAARSLAALAGLLTATVALVAVLPPLLARALSAIGAAARALGG